MKHLLAGLALVSLAAGAQAQDRPEGGQQPRGSYANPSAVIATEIAFARLAQEKGQWTAFRETAAPDAVMFAPGMVLAHDWLKRRADPPVALAWQPHEVWSSCDGSMMLTTGAWQRGDKHGWFTTVWQRQPRGGYQWVFDHGDETKDAVAAPEMIAAHVAECPERRARPAGPPPGAAKKSAKPPLAVFDPARREGASGDGTLTWLVTAEPSGQHEFTTRMRQDGAMKDIRSERVSGG